MAKKCVHKGCGKTYTDDDEACIYHPGPPEFHEGQKGWKCCKPRVLTFDEFLSIPPCTTGKHSTVDETPAAAVKTPSTIAEAPAPAPFAPPPALIATSAPQDPPKQPAPQPESEDDDPSISISAGQACRRHGCKATYSLSANRDEESCVHHPGAPIFHEGSKGYLCCKRRVLEFDEFMKIEGCNTKNRHLFVGSGKKKENEENLSKVRHDFYQTATSVVVSLYLKKIDKAISTVAFPSSTSVDLNLITSDNKRYKTEVPLFGAIDPEKSSFRILGTKLELTLVKVDGAGWPTLRSDDPLTGEIIQVGDPSRVH